MVRARGEVTGRGSSPPTEQGVRLAWADMAVHWATVARRLIEAHGFLDVQLGYIALHLSVMRESMLVNGYRDEVTGFVVQARRPGW